MGEMERERSLKASGIVKHLQGRAESIVCSVGIGLRFQNTEITSLPSITVYLQFIAVDFGAQSNK